MALCNGVPVEEAHVPLCILILAYSEILIWFCMENYVVMGRKATVKDLAVRIKNYNRLSNYSSGITDC